MPRPVMNSSIGALTALVTGGFGGILTNRSTVTWSEMPAELSIERDVVVP